jgi:DedD protein
MKLAFWKSKQSRRKTAKSPTAGPQPDYDTLAADDEADEQRIEILRVRARRRLIGAAALLLLVVILVPMLLDPAPRAIPDNIPIDLPSERTPFTPKPGVPPAEAPGPSGDAGVPAAPGSAADAAAADAAVADAAAGAGEQPAQAAPARADGRGARIFVQAAALAKESAARELANRLDRSGLASFVERTQSNGNTRYRVRLGPFATRDEAERARARLHALGVNSNIVVA